MKLEVSIRPASAARPAEPSEMMDVRRAANKLAAVFGGRAVEADAVEVSPGVYSVLTTGRSYEVHLSHRGTGTIATADGHEFIVEIVDPRAWRRGRGGAIEAEGRQEILASMPGKVVRILAAAGTKVEARQGVLVIEAMKMQNELRSPKSGTVEKLLVREGQTVNSGEVLAVIV